MTSLSKLVSSGRLLLADGAWGSNLIERGLDIDRGCAEGWNLTRPDEVRTLAEKFARAGAGVATTNTFGGNRLRLAAFGLTAHIREINTRGVELIKEAAGPNTLVAASLGPTGVKDIGGRATEIGDAFGEQSRILADAGADILLLETMTSPEEAGVALRALKAATGLDVVCSFAFRQTTDGRFCTWSGAGVRAALQAAQASGADMVGVNCYPADESLGKLLFRLRESSGGAMLWLKPNAGPAQPGHGRAAYPFPVHQMPLPLETLAGLGVAVLGGCCGTTPEHIQTLAGAVAAFNRAAP